MGADPQATGTVARERETITGATPLWAAAAAGHLEVCKLLINSGVNVNQATNNNSTPLRGACCDGHLEIGSYLDLALQ
jgi:ankyrin repeat protein